MATVMLVRHGRTAANAGGTLAGTAPGTHLDEQGETQSNELGQLLALLEPAAIISSPLERTMQTAGTLAKHIGGSKDLRVTEEPGIIECDYGDWTGKALSELSDEPLWSVVQNHPSSVVFPSGEGMAAMQGRAVSAIRRWNDLLGPEALYIAVSHGDVIKSIVADALGTHLDHFQRITIDPCSVSVIRYSDTRPFVLGVNGNGSNVERFVNAAKETATEAAVGGGTT